jgi:hypothetical protein
MPMNPRLLRPIASGVQALPRKIAGLEGWWDFSDAGTLTIDTGVSEVRDKSGNGYHATQAVGSDQPLLIASAKNGLSAADFDGSGTEWLQTANIASDLTAFTVFQVFKADALDAFESLWSRGGDVRFASNSNVVGDVYRVGTENNGNAIRNGPVMTVGQWHLGVSSWSGVADKQEIGARLDLVDAAGTSATSYSITSVANTPWRIGSRGVTSNWNGLIGETIAYNRLLTDTERDQVEAFLNAKWDLGLL